MALLSVIRRWHFRNQLSIREISRRTGLSRNTVRRYLRDETVEPAFTGSVLSENQQTRLRSLTCAGVRPAAPVPSACLDPLGGGGASRCRCRVGEFWGTGCLCLRTPSWSGERHTDDRQGHAAPRVVRIGGIRAADRLAECARPHPSGGGAPDLRRGADGLGPLGDLADGRHRGCVLHRPAGAPAKLG